MMVGVVVSVCLADDLRSDGEKFRKRCSHLNTFGQSIVGVELEESSFCFMNNLMLQSRFKGCYMLLRKDSGV